MPLVGRLSLISVVCAAVLGVSTAFTAAPPFPSRTSGRLTPVQASQNQNEPDFVKHAVKTFGVLSLGSILAFNVADASATPPPDVASMPVSTVSSSSTQLAVEVKTMDMTLPSYGAISDAKNTQESLSSLFIEQPPARDVKPKAAPKKQGQPMKVPSMSSFLPSLDKEGPKKEAQDAGKKAQLDAAKAEKRAEFEKAAAEKAAQKKEDATNREAAEQERKAKLAADKVEAKAKAEEQKLKAAEQEKEDRGLDSAKVQIVEMDMPTYSGATETKAKSPFAL